MMKSALICLLGMFSAAPLYAGIMPAATRMVYTEGQREKTLMLANTNAYPVIIQSWIDDGAGHPDFEQAPFVILPAVFRLEPGERQGLRIIYNQDPLPTDRESVFWINLYEIPPLEGKKSQDARLTLAMNTQLKLFWRPKALATSLEESIAKLNFRLRQENGGWGIECDNPSPLNVSFTSITLLNGGQEKGVKAQMDMMTKAYSRRIYPLEAFANPPTGQKIRFRYLNDDGASVEHTVLLKP